MAGPLPKGSLVLVSGANGFIASHIVDQCLQAGYNVRGSVRSAEKGAWLKDYVAETYGPNRLELAIVPDMCAEGAFDGVVDGVSAFIHVASDLSFSADVDAVVGGVLRGVKTALSAASSSATMKHFIYTSSAAAVFFPVPDTPISVDVDTWNDESYRIAMDASITPDRDPFKAAHVYSASKMAGEKAVWDFSKTQDRIVVNSVVPNMNWGPVLAPGKQDRLSSGGLLIALYEHGLAGLSFFKDVPPQFHIDVRDVARLHIAPLLDPTIKSERIFAFSEVYDWENMLKIIHELRPEWKNTEEYVEKRKCLITIEPRPRTEEILRNVFGQPGLIGMRESVEANLRHLK